MRIDSHQHFWRLSRGDYGWIRPDMTAIYADFLPPDLAPRLAAGGIDRTVLVQAAPTEADTQFLLGLARETAFIAGVVGWTDLAAPDAADRIAALARDPHLLGLRPMLQDMADDGWMLSEAIAPAVRAMLSAGLRFDALVLPRHLANLRGFAERYADLPIVIDHGAKPFIAARQIEPWARDMRRLAAETPLLCKLSGLANEAAPGWTADDLRPYSDVLVEAFGPKRLMWGSDWPVLRLAGDYAGWLATAQALTAGLSEDDRSWIFGRTAAAFYGLTP